MTDSHELPGGPAIERLIQARIDQHAPVAVLFIDLINFESYYRQYGWLKGTQMIDLLSKSIRDALTGDATSDVLGHIAGDQFVVLSTPERAEALAQEIIKRFDTAVPEFYSEADRQRGYFDTVDRRGNPYRAYHAGVAIAIVTNVYRALEHSLQVAGLAAEVQKYIKMMPGSRFAFDRRQK